LNGSFIENYALIIACILAALANLDYLGISALRVEQFYRLFCYCESAFAFVTCIRFDCEKAIL
jgi:hypothetical protein